MNKTSQLLVAALSCGLTVGVACSDDDGDDGPAPGGNNNAGMMNNNDGMANNNAMANNNMMAGPTVTLTFTIDDTANNSYGPEGAQPYWNDFDGDGRVNLTDDGNGLWTASVERAIPATDATFGYGANVEFENGHDNWIWAYDSRHNGSYTIPANAMDGSTIMVPGLTIPAHGDWNVVLTLNTSSVTADFAGEDLSNGVAIKFSRNAFENIVLMDDGTNGDDMANDGIYTFDLEQQIEAAEMADMGGTMETVGLLASGERMEFIWTFSVSGTEYKDANGALTEGVGVSLQNTATSSPAFAGGILRLRNDRNTAVIATSSVSQTDIRVTVNLQEAVDNGPIGSTTSTDSAAFFTSSWISVQADGGSGTFIALPMFDDGNNGDEMANDRVHTFVLSEWVGGQWEAQGNDDLRSSGLLYYGGDPLGRDTVPADAESRFKIRFDDGDFYNSLVGVTVEARYGTGPWFELDAASFETNGFGDYFLVIPAP